MRPTALVIMSFLVLAPAAYAQEPHRGYLQGVGGVTFGTEPSHIFGGAAGISLGPRVQVIVEIGRMGDVLPRSVRRDINDAFREIGETEGVDISANVKARATYLAVGARINAPARGRIAPFATLVVGSARISPKLGFRIEGVDVTPSDELLEEAGVTSGREPLLGVGGGVEIAIHRRLGVELGYQYNRIFTEDPAINTHRALTGINVKF